VSFIGAPVVSRGGVRPGFAALAAKSVDGVTQLADLAQFSPLRLLFPRVPEDEPLTACLANTAGGVVGGDALDLEVRAEEGARVLAMGQAAEKIYRSAGATARIGITLTAGPRAWLEWLPQETIVFEGARVIRRTSLAVDATARAMTGEILVFGRTAHGESLAHGLIRDAISVTRDGRLIWADALHLGGDLARPLAHPAAFGGARACALLLLHAPEPETHRDALRELAPPEGVRFGATVVAGLMIARWLAADTQALRRHYGSAWALLRARAGGLPPRLPPLWHV
jgi:urease accessory protein